ncbi:MAG: ATP-grasp fold amidoligase family protein [Saprospiraceae bacterium]|nr:ATP-grasp fold amidoligase family protein [Saprospiraceae bacterium]
MDLENPKSFNEKINYLKLHTRYDLASIVADKYRVREYVKGKIGETYLIPLIGIYKKAEDIAFHELPNQFALKTNHGSGWNVICREKSNLNIKRVVKKLNTWLNFNAYYLSREYQYKDIKALILCEELLRYNIEDYKFFCFEGEPKFIQVDVGRFTYHERAYYDLDWNLLPFSICYPITGKDLLRPEKLEEMISISKKLACDFFFSRIDLYLHNDKIFFGEITLFPEGGSGPFIKKDQDFMVGEYLELK